MGFDSVSLTLMPERQGYRQDILHSDSPLLVEDLHAMFGPWESALFLTELCLTGRSGLARWKSRELLLTLYATGPQH